MNPDRIIAIVNQKGGVGKTTTSINLAAALAAKDMRVLLIDMDPQGNASTGLGIPRAAREKTIYNVLTEDLAVDDALIATGIENLFVLPSHVDLSAAEMEIGQTEGRTRILRDAITASQSKFDYVMIDCPPSLNLLTINALSAARSVIVPLQCEFFALEGLSQLLQTVEMAKSSINPALAIDGVMLTMYDRRNRLSAQVAEDVRKHLGRAVFEPNSKGAKAYLDLADELIKKHRNRN